MTTEKMASTYICCIAAVILVLIAKETSNHTFEETMMGLVQKGTKKYSLSPLYCINECLRRACCTAVGYSPAKGLKPYSCLFKCHNSTEMTDPGMCESRFVLKHKIPTVLAGACQDHKCKWKELCVAKPKGGYKCIRGRGK